MMATPRFISSLVRQPRVQQQPKSQGSWTAGTVQSSGGAINAVFRVSLEGTGEIVAARSSLDFPIVAGSQVYVVRSGSDYVIAGMR